MHRLTDESLFANMKVYVRLWVCVQNVDMRCYEMDSDGMARSHHEIYTKKVKR